MLTRVHRVGRPEIGLNVGQLAHREGLVVVWVAFFM